MKQKECDKRERERLNRLTVDRGQTEKANHSNSLMQMFPITKKLNIICSFKCKYNQCPELLNDLTRKLTGNFRKTVKYLTLFRNRLSFSVKLYGLI